MSRNRGSRSCAFCDDGGTVVLTETPRPITNEDAGRYFQECEGMLVAFAECSFCHSKYLAWCDDTTGKTRHTLFDRQCSEEVPFFDLSFRSTFDDEFGDADLPTSPPMKAKPPMHPTTKHVLQFFTYEHLKSPLREVSQKFAELAQEVAEGPQNPETTVALRKLLEAKDCAVRAYVVKE